MGEVGFLSVIYRHLLDDLRKLAKNVANIFENTADHVRLLNILILRYLQYFNLKTYIGEASF